MAIFRGRVLLSLILVFIGVVMLLNNLNVDINIELGDLFRTYWPVLPLLGGISVLVDSGGKVREDGTKVAFSKGGVISGIIIIIISGAYLARNLGFIDVDFSLLWRLFWPGIFILAGLSLLKGKKLPSGSKTNWAVMGGVDKGKTPWDLKSDSYVAFMGGIELDLSKANIPEGETLLDCTAFMGGIEIRVPEGIALICEGNAILGGIEFFNEETGGVIASKKVEIGLNENSTHIIRIQARAIMGGIEVKKV